MSGPIVRKYGFPNHEQIFGRRPGEPGVEEPTKDEAKAETAERPRSEKKDDQRGA